MLLFPCISIYCPVFFHLHTSHVQHILSQPPPYCLTTKPCVVPSHPQPLIHSVVVLAGSVLHVVAGDVLQVTVASGMHPGGLCFVQHHPMASLPSAAESTSGIFNGMYVGGWWVHRWL